MIHYSFSFVYKTILFNSAVCHTSCAIFEIVLSHRYEGNMVIILAGYPDEIDRLLNANPGLHRRITERLEFKSWEPHHCLNLLQNLSRSDGIDLSSELNERVLNGFQDLSLRSGWGSAGDVRTIYDKMTASLESRCYDAHANLLNFSDVDVDSSFDALIRQRPRLKGQIKPSESVLLSAEATNTIDFIHQQHKTTSSNEKSSASSRIFELKQEKECDPADDDVWAALDEALNVMGYDLYQIRDILISQDLPNELVNMVSSRVSRPPERMRSILTAQCSNILPNVLKLISDIEAELERQRQVREAIEKAEAEERKRLEEQEMRRKEQEKMKRLNMIGRCCMGFAWHREG
jgi:hypothetical protein